MAPIPTPDLAAGRLEGEQGRDLGTALATVNRWERSLAGELAFLYALATPGATATTDVIPDDLAAAYGDGGKWGGGDPLRLPRVGIIREVQPVRTIRPSRHASKIGQYALADPAKADARRAELRRLLNALPRPAAELITTAQPTLF